MAAARRVFLVAAVGLAVVAPAPVAAAERVVPVAEILGSPGAYDGMPVVVEGELIGDYGRRGDGTTWLQLNDDGYARTPLLDGGELSGVNVGIAVRVPDRFVAGLDRPGGYRRHGPVVRIGGTWRYHDPGRGGESYIDASAFELLEAGHPTSEPVSLPVATVGGGLLVAAGALEARRRVAIRGA